MKVTFHVGHISWSGPKRNGIIRSVLPWCSGWCFPHSRFRTFPNCSIYFGGAKKICNVVNPRIHLQLSGWFIQPVSVRMVLCGTGEPPDSHTQQGEANQWCECWFIPPWMHMNATVLCQTRYEVVINHRLTTAIALLTIIKLVDVDGKFYRTPWIFTLPWNIGASIQSSEKMREITYLEPQKDRADTGWGPKILKLPYEWLNSMVYGRYNYSQYSWGL